MKVSVILPSIKRPTQLQRCLDGLLDTTRGHDVECIVVVEGDPATVDALAGYDVRVISRLRHHGPVYGWNEGARAATGDALMLAGDDIEWGEGWLDEALNAVEHLPDREGMIGFNDGKPETDGTQFFPHYMLTRQHLINDHGGCLGVPHYRAYCVDMEAFDRSKRVGRVAYAAKSNVIHHHYTTGAKMDAVYQRSKRSEGFDLEVYNWRKELDFPDDYPAQIGPNVPTGPNVFWCLLRPSRELTDRRSLAMTAHNTRRGYYQIDMPYARTDVTRNRLERRFRNLSTNENDVLVMLDGDHDHPYSIVEDLAIQNVPVLGAWCTLRGPFINAMFRRVDGNLEPVTDWPDGEIIKVDAVGTGAIAIKRHVFEELEAKEVYAPFFRYAYQDETEYQPSEDLYFMLACELKGIDVACHTGVYSPHVIDGLI